MDQKLPKLTSDAQRNTIVEAITNGGKLDQKTVNEFLVSMSMDAETDRGEIQTHIKDQGERLDALEDHPLHKITAKRAMFIVVSFLTLSGIYIKESRDFVVDFLVALLVP
jgi:hypothetical protein